MSVQVETALPEEQTQIVAELIRTVFSAETDGRVRQPGDLRLAILAWLLDLTIDPRIAARSILTRRRDTQAAALPRIVTEILEEIADCDLARIRIRRRRRAGRKRSN